MALAPRLLDWYQTHRRHLPWREDPTPYHVDVSEIMLQQTQVDTVIPYYLDFLRAFPTLEDLASASEEEVLKRWEGLGYYSRGRHLHSAAQRIVRDFGGQVPAKLEDLLSLPGIGNYTAKAILAIAFHAPAIAMDGNLVRVYARLEEKGESHPEKMKAYGEAYFLKELGAADPSAFNQALMDLGEMICLPHALPRCADCPLAAWCQARLHGTMLNYPPSATSKEKRQENKTVYLLTYQGKIALRKRPSKGLLASLYEFPNESGDLSLKNALASLQRQGLEVASLEKAGKKDHVFSHLIWHLTGFRGELLKKPAPADWLWVSPEELATRYPLPRAFAPFKRRVLKDKSAGKPD